MALIAFKGKEEHIVGLALLRHIAVDIEHVLDLRHKAIRHLQVVGETCDARALALRHVFHLHHIVLVHARDGFAPALCQILLQLMTVLYMRT